jgi:hypothetical protein
MVRVEVEARFWLTAVTVVARTARKNIWSFIFLVWWGWTNFGK